MSQHERHVNAFLKALASDRAAGLFRPCADYVARWPEAADAVAAAYRAATEPETPRVSDTADENAAARDRAIAPPERPVVRFGDYDLLRPLGRGGQGEVHLARDRRLGRLVALKVLDAGPSWSASAELRFRREAELAAGLDHPGLGTVFEAGRVDGRAYLAAAYHGGGSLAAGIEAARDRGERNGIVPTDRAAAARLAGRFAQLADALDAAHRGGVLHRDLKPSNVMRREDGAFVLIDFGLARAVAEEATPAGFDVTASGDVFGTPAYLAPELVAGTARADVRTDLYAFGATLFEALTGRRAFDGPTREAVFERVLRTDAPRASATNPAVPRELDAVVETLLDKNPARRYADAAALAADLRAVAEGRPVSVVRLSAAGRLLRRARRRPGVVALAALAAVLFAAACTLFGLRLADLPVVREAERRARAAEAERLLEEGTFELHHGRKDVAEELILRAEALDPESTEARALAVVAALARGGTFDEARARDLYRRGGAEIDAPLRALAAAATGATTTAEALIDAAPTPKTAVGRYLRGVALLRLVGCDAPADATTTRRREAALRELDLAVASAPVARRLYHLERLHAASHVGDAARRRDVVAAAAPSCAGSLIGAVWSFACLSAADDFDGALAVADDALARHGAELAARPRMRAALFADRLSLLWRAGRVVETLSAADAFDREFPDLPDGRIKRAVAAFSAGRVEDAAADVRALEARGLPPESDVALRRAFLLVAAATERATGRRDRAESRLTEAVGLPPQEGGPWYDLATLRMGSDPQAALGAARRAAELLPDDPRTWGLVGALETDPARAERALYRADLAEGGGRRAADFAGAEYGRRLAARGAFSAARKAYARSVEAGFEPARGELAELLAELGERAALEALARDGLRLRPDDPYPTLAAAFAARERGAFDEAARLAERSMELARAARRPPPDAAPRLAREARAMARGAATTSPKPRPTPSRRPRRRRAARGAARRCGVGRRRRRTSTRGPRRTTSRSAPPPTWCGSTSTTPIRRRGPRR
jgi:tetratricopeptide (TPR) repeat protein